MTSSPSIFDSAAIFAMVERRACAESYLLRIILAAPAETAAVLRSLGARADMITQDDLRVMMHEVLALSLRRKNLSQLDALQNVMIGLREAECWDLSATAVMQGPRWTLRGLVAFATWFGGRGCGRIAAIGGAARSRGESSIYRSGVTRGDEVLDDGESDHRGGVRVKTKALTEKDLATLAKSHATALTPQLLDVATARAAASPVRRWKCSASAIRAILAGTLSRWSTVPRKLVGSRVVVAGRKDW